jgi:hypothetical protein
MHHKSKIAVIIIKIYNQSKQAENIIKMGLCLNLISKKDNISFVAKDLLDRMESNIKIKRQLNDREIIK